jgi:hypothetical protein
MSAATNSARCSKTLRDKLKPETRGKRREQLSQGVVVYDNARPHSDDHTDGVRLRL